MRILLTRTSNERHRLEIIRDDASREHVDLVTREALFHDLLHYAVESALPTGRGFWGTLAEGKTFADLNDRTGEATRENAGTLLQVEGIVGVMTGVAGLPAADALERLRWFSDSQRQPLPDWCTEAFVAAVTQRMRQLLGRWRATPFGETLEIVWDPEAPD